MGKPTGEHIPSNAACTLRFNVWPRFTPPDPGPDAADGGFVRLIPTASSLCSASCSSLAMLVPCARLQVSLSVDLVVDEERGKGTRARTLTLKVNLSLARLLCSDSDSVVNPKRAGRWTNSLSTERPPRTRLSTSVTSGVLGCDGTSCPHP